MIQEAYEEKESSDAPDEKRPALTASKDDLTATERANLALFMTEEQLRPFKRCIELYNRDVASRAERMKRLKDLQKMYALVAEQKNFPFHKAANVKTPTLTGPNLQIHARLFDMVWPASGRVFTVVPASAMDAPVAGKTESFANSYVRYSMPYMAQGLDDTLHQLCLYGSAFRRTYWDGAQRKVRSDWIPIEDFVVAYSQRSQDPSMSDVKRYTMVHHMSMMDLEAFGEEGIFVNVDKVKARSGERTDRSEFSDMADKVDGVYAGDVDDDEDRQVLEQHCSWKMPNAPDVHPAFDGKRHYIVVTLDAVTEEVMRISLREEDDPDDRRRFEREMLAYQQYAQQMQVYASAQQSFEQTVAAPPGVMVAPPQMPMPPEPVDEPKPIRKRQICFFTHYRCFPSDGFYGIGYGDLLYGLCLATNTLLNQHVDGVTLKNAKPMFMSRQVRMQRGSVNVQPGEVVEIDGPVGDIRNAIMFLDPPQNDPTTVPLVRMLDGMKDAMVGSSDIMSGQVPGSNQTKAGMQILAEQALAPISVLGRRVREAFRHELEKIWRCWGVFLEDDDFADYVGDGGQPQQSPITKAMFTPNARLVPASDSRMKSQRIEDHMTLFQYAMQNPYISQNPQVGPAIMAKLTEDGFRIFPDGEKFIPLLQPPPPPPPQPKPQWAENAGFLKGEDSPVLEPDNDDEHIAHMEMFFQSPEAKVMDKTGRDMAEKHFRAHFAQRLMKKGQAIEQARQPAGPPGGGPGPMAGHPGIGTAGPPPGIGA